MEPRGAPLCSSTSGSAVPATPRSRWSSAWLRIIFWRASERLGIDYDGYHSMLRDMPMIDVTYPAGFISDEQRQALANDLTTALLHAERAPDTEFFRSITWAIVHELPVEHVFAAGRAVEAPIVRVEA